MKKTLIFIVLHFFCLRIESFAAIHHPHSVQRDTTKTHLSLQHPVTELYNKSDKVALLAFGAFMATIGVVLFSCLILLSSYRLTGPGAGDSARLFNVLGMLILGCLLISFLLGVLAWRVVRRLAPNKQKSKWYALITMIASGLMSGLGLLIFYNMYLRIL
ncbi:MAG: hypothetical protein RL329_2301 [Bacteroidota bacterium]|jgi:magnesium-transporting ATPase (P-type)